ncbi:MAG: hypothetical protein HQK65_06435 [Desulfamplus sp.]|nr:hypothetical protein [Desulfamplus sp.]
MNDNCKFFKTFHIFCLFFLSFVITDLCEATTSAHLIVLQVNTLKDINLKIKYEKIRSVWLDNSYKTELFPYTKIEKNKQIIVSFIVTRDEKYDKEIYTLYVDNQEYKIIKKPGGKKKPNIPNIPNIQYDYDEISIPDQTLNFNDQNPNDSISKFIIFKALKNYKYIVQPDSSYQSEIIKDNEYFILDRDNLPEKIIEIDNNNELVGLYMKNNLVKLSISYTPIELSCAFKDYSVKLHKDIKPTSDNLSFAVTFNNQSFNIHSYSKNNQVYIRIINNLEPNQIFLISPEGLNRVKPSLSWDKDKNQVNISPNYPKNLSLNKDGNAIIKIQLENISTDGNIRLWFSEKELSDLKKQLYDWLYKRISKISVNALYARRTEIVPEIINDTISLSLDNLNFYHTRFTLLSPDPTDCPQIDLAGWTLRKENDSATLSATGKLPSYILLQKIGKKDSDTFYLHPPATSPDVLLKPVKVRIDNKNLKLEMDYEYPPQNAESLNIRLYPHQFRGFAPAVEIEMKDGKMIELVDEADRYYKKENCIYEGVDSKNCINGNEGIAIDLDKINAMTPLGLSSYGRTELRKSKIEAMLQAIGQNNEEDRVKKWKEFFERRSNGLDVYTGKNEQNAPVLIQKSGSSGNELDFLPCHLISNRYRTLPGINRNGTKLWDGSAWLSLDEKMLGHYKFISGSSDTAYILISAVTLFDQNSIGSVTSENSDTLQTPHVSANQPDPLGFLNKPIDGKTFNNVENIGTSAPQKQSLVDPVGKFMVLWKYSVDALLSKLKEMHIQEIKVKVFVVYTSGEKYNYSELSSISLNSLKNNNAAEEMRRNVPINFRKASSEFSNSSTLSRSPRNLVRKFAEYLSDQLKPGSYLLFIAPDGDRLSIHRDNNRNSIFQTNYLIGLFKANPDKPKEEIKSLLDKNF